MTVVWIKEWTNASAPTREDAPRTTMAKAGPDFSASIMDRVFDQTLYHPQKDRQTLEPTPFVVAVDPSAGRIR